MLYLDDAIHTFTLFRFDKMEVDDFKILLIDVTFYPQHAQKLVFNVLAKNGNPNIIGIGGYVKRIGE